MKPGFLSRTLNGLAMLLGRQPTKPEPEEMTEDSRALHAFKKTPAERKRRKAAIAAERAEEGHSHKWRNRRWASIIAVNGVFVLSYWLDLQLVEGALTASRVFGFHFADLNSSLQLMLAHKHVVLNLVIGVTTVLALYLLFGGRSFCSWVCPYHLLSEIAEMLHLKLADKRLVKNHELDRRLRVALFVVFAALAFATGYTLFETISPVGIVSRALIYGGGVALVWVGALLLIEVFFIRRAWCRYACPIGLTYGFLGGTSPVKIQWDASKCLHEGNCRNVCLVPHVLEFTIKSRAHDSVLDAGPDCTRCGMCLEACLPGALSFRIKGVGDML